MVATSSHLPPPFSDVEDVKVTSQSVDGVPGALVFKNVLTEAECKIWQEFIKCVHDSLPEERFQRRSSQLHTPCHVDKKLLEPLCRRLRSALPAHAGPNNFSTLAEEGSELSTFLRLYRYLPGERSSPHFDRSQTEHEQAFESDETSNTGKTGGRMTKFTAYSLVIYLDESFDGGETTFFTEFTSRAMLSRSGLTLSQEEESKLQIANRVKPKTGDAVLFPHGNHEGCHPNPFHEGTLVSNGIKTIVRTDVVYNVPLDTHKNRKSKKERQANKGKCEYPEIDRLLRLSAAKLSSQEIVDAITFKYSNVGKKKSGVDLMVDAGAQIYWAYRRQCNGGVKGGPEIPIDINGEEMNCRQVSERLSSILEGSLQSTESLDPPIEVPVQLGSGVSAPLELCLRQRGSKRKQEEQ